VTGVQTCALPIFYRSGLALSIHADVIYEGDDFIVDRGEVSRHTKWEWRPIAQRPEMRGNLRGAYATVRLKGGGEASVVMTKDEIDAIRKRSKSGNSGPWVTDYEEMAKKTAFKRLTKWVPISAEVRNAIEVDDDREDTIVASRNSVLIGQAMGAAPDDGDDSRTIEGTVARPEWADDLQEARILLEHCKTQDAHRDIEQASLEKHSDPKWRMLMIDMLRDRWDAIERGE
jgi:recombinational DNA repair protein RecT